MLTEERAADVPTGVLGFPMAGYFTVAKISSPTRRDGHRQGPVTAAEESLGYL